METFKDFLNEKLDSFQKKSFNRTLKITFPDYEQLLWNYYRTDKTIGKWIKTPTVANINKWYDFWKDKIEFKDLDREYFEFVIKKKRMK